MLKMLAIAALLTTGTAPAAPPAPACLTRQQIGDISVVSVASMFETARNACRPHLPATAFLATPAAAEYSGRLRAEARQRLTSALAGVTSIVEAAGMTREVIRNMGEEGIAEGVGTDLAHYLNPALCADINEILEISAELTPDQTGRFFGAFGSLVDRIIRILPPEAFGPGHDPIPLIPSPPRSAPATPAPAATPAALAWLRSAPRPGPAPAPEAAPSRPQPFLCRPGE